MPTSPLHLRALAYRFPDAGAALAEIAHLRAVRELPRGTIHVVSDVHGEFRKLEHILRNGSGSLRPLVENLFAARLDAAARALLLNLVYYPRETWAKVSAGLASDEARAAFARDTLLRELELLRILAARYDLRHVQRTFPAPYRELFVELLAAPLLARDDAYTTALLGPFIADDQGAGLLRATAHTLRAFASYELVVAGDLGDRGPRIDRVIDAIRRQSNVRIVWGNHDAEWMGACLGQEALVATVVRISLRYGRIAQLEEGYGIPVEPLEQLARAAYGDDPAERFQAKGADLRDPLLLARMQKAVAILQFKLEGQTTRRNPQFDLEHRNLLHRIDPAAGTVTIDGKGYPLLDRALPTIDFADPYRLTEAEAKCIGLLRQSFLDSAALWRDMRFVEERGSMLAVRDENVIFHGCVPVDAEGRPLTLEVDGAALGGRALFTALDGVVRRAFRERRAADLDLLYYLWAGPRSPLFGKDRMATFETYFVADKATHKETKNPYFELIHEPAFCERIATELGGTGDVLIVNGHVPVKLEGGESPLKRSGKAVTIDGAFSEAYGDHGFTLVIGAERTYLAKHHHFESVETAIERGADIVPEIQDLRVHPRPLRVADTARGAELAQEIDALVDLVRAYREHTFEPA
ncbi:MAG TPA: fructose-bisphosphatase class III [Polyangiaceae bacterium]|jgi:fructose-1,6-bisphosphatase-3